MPDRVWKRVFENYLKAYCHADKTALLFGVREGQETTAALSYMQETLEAAGDEAPLVLTHPLEDRPSVPVLRQVDCLITTKGGDSLVGRNLRNRARLLWERTVLCTGRFHLERQGVEIVRP